MCADTDAILAEQLKHIANPDREARFAFVMPALSPDEATRDAFLREPVQRREPAARTVGARRPRVPESSAAPAHAERYIEPSLTFLHGDSADGRHFLPDPLDAGGARRPQLARRGADRHGVSRRDRRTIRRGCGRSFEQISRSCCMRATRIVR